MQILVFFYVFSRTSLLAGHFGWNHECSQQNEKEVKANRGK
jgi:hypothetical protein